MKSVFKYSSRQFAASYAPGISGYGQRGSAGPAGKGGSSAWYTPYDLSDGDQLAECEKRLNAGLSLSDNLETAGFGYEAGDIVADGRGYLHCVVRKSSTEIGLSSKGLETMTFLGYSAPVKSFSAGCITNFLKGADFSWKQDNPDYVGCRSPKFCHRFYGTETKYKSIFGNWVLFRLVLEDSAEESEYEYTFTLAFPNGEKASVSSASPVAAMFVDNRACYECRESSSFSYGGRTLREILSFGTSSLSTSAEDSAEAARACSAFIAANCRCYADMKSTSTGEIRRIALDDEQGAGSVTPAGESVWWTVESNPLKSLGQRYISYPGGTSYSDSYDGTRHGAYYYGTAYAWTHGSEAAYDEGKGNVLRLNFRNASSIEIEISYSMLQSGTPATECVIGKVDADLSADDKTLDSYRADAAQGGITVTVANTGTVKAAIALAADALDPFADHHIDIGFVNADDTDALHNCIPSTYAADSVFGAPDEATAAGYGFVPELTVCVKSATGAKISNIGE